MKKVLFISMMCLMALTMVQCGKDEEVPDGYVDLGLPSGLLWKAENEPDRMDYNTAVAKYGSELPTAAQFQELIDQCDWKWSGSGYKVFGPNGNTMTIRAKGYIDCFGNFSYDGTGGYYWSSTEGDYPYRQYLYFISNQISIGGHQQCCEQSIRLVKAKK